MFATLGYATTQYIEARGARIGYRRLGPRSGIPLILLQHFTGTMDAWDPAVVNALAKERPVIAFNNTGVGTSSGVAPDSVEQMTSDAEGFITALGFEEVDLLGFSLGGFIAQLMSTRTKVNTRKIVLAGTAPEGGEEHLLQVVGDAYAKNAPDVRLPLFFTQSESSQRAGRTFLGRVSSRTRDRDPDNGKAVSTPQAKAIIDWCARTDGPLRSFSNMTKPVLIVHGSDDTMFPPINAYKLAQSMSNATLILYPDSGHGALFQYPETFVAHVNLFLSA